MSGEVLIKMFYKYKYEVSYKGSQKIIIMHSTSIHGLANLIKIEVFNVFISTLETKQDTLVV